MLGLRHELTRKALHLTSSAAPLSYAFGLERRRLLLVLCVLAAVAVSLELARRRVPRVRLLFGRATGPLLRKHEHEGWSGATWMLLAFVGVVALTPRAAAIASMWAVAVGDAAAAVVGRALATRRELLAAARGEAVAPRTRKSVAGSAACFVATLVGALWLADLGPVVSIVAAVAATLAEWPRVPLDDNVRVAGAVAGVVMLCNFLLAS